ncbi:hypothetical protein [Flavobacterium sp. GT3R68]|uniref:hypothetical protein n=1 Tax=Flavobacterium sp. GT3R68 TaxID=2594437 RepID=UPI000F897321|nr:hypothetical protein [Flavobacterium sp. GT3R68]RTY86314.1 hypothetical protein EKL32_27855 [Flavobacterium sp. GSN2]TRW91922.1 hypothetical protein FNW07_08540 [Flavobacterium sp. GT3R68]
MKRIILISVITLIGGFFILVASLLITEYKSYEISERDCKKTEGVVTQIGESGIKDISFNLAENDTSFYINRGLENRFDLEDLRNEMLGKKVTIFYSDHTTILSRQNLSRHIRKLDIGNKTFYSEF